LNRSVRLVVAGFGWVDVLRTVDGPLARVVHPVAAVAVDPHLELGLSLLRAQRQPVADHAVAQPLELLGGVAELAPGRRRLADARLLEQRLVVEEQAGARDEGEAVLGSVDRRVVRERGEEVRHRLLGDHLRGLVQEVVRRVLGELVDVEQVGLLASGDERRDLLVDVVPVDDLQVDLVTGIRLLELRDQVLPVGLDVLGVLRRDEGDGAALALARRFGPALARRFGPALAGAGRARRGVAVRAAARAQHERGDRGRGRDRQVSPIHVQPPSP
jgi:hypothetical protein